MYDSLYSVFTWTVNWFVKLQFLRYVGFTEDQIFALMDTLNLMPLEVNWLGSPVLAMAAVIVVNTWVGLPFFAITLLAGLISIPQEFYEAAEVDGAGNWSQFLHVTLPLLKPVLAVVLLFSTIFTFSDFNIVYILTRGGPINSTHLFATLTNAYAFESLQIGKGAAVSLFMFPILVVVVFFQLRYIRKE
jgi:multiple sugar transport system permease protein